MLEPSKKNCYKGNLKLKKAGLIESFSFSELFEISKCQDDYEYFIKNYLKIKTLDKGVSLIEPFEYQYRMLRHIHENRFTIFLMPRQQAKTTTVTAYLLWLICFKLDYEVAIIANKLDQAQEILGRIKLAYEELPYFLQAGVVIWNTGDIKLGNGSLAFVSSASNGGLRGKSCNCLYMDEFSFISNDLEVFAESTPVVSSGKSSKIIITSTPKGLNLFYKLCMEAKEGRNDYKLMQVHWNEHPERTEEWAKKERRNNPRFNVEYECEFAGSSDTLISTKKLQQMVMLDPIHMDKDHKTAVYENPVKDAEYVVVVDVAEGVEKDFSVVSIFKVSEKPYKHVLCYRNNAIHPLTLGDVVYGLCKFYNNAMCLVEANNYGQTVLNTLYYDREYDNVIKTGSFKSDVKVTSVHGSRLGVLTTKKTKREGCSNLKALIEADALVTNDVSAISELSTFVKYGDSYKAEKDKHDDVVMTFVIFAWFTMQNYFAECFDVNMRNEVRQNLECDDMTDLYFSFISNGIDNPFEGDSSFFANGLVSSVKPH